MDPNKYSDKKRQGCNDCSYLTPGCTFCRTIRADELIFNNAVDEKYRGIVRCAGCAGGLYVDEKTGACVPAPENCADFSQGNCQSCLFGYSLHESRCVSTTMPNCLNELKEGQCSQCRDGYFLDPNMKCQACSPGCLGCNGPNNTDCTRCPITGYKLEVSSPSKMDFFRFKTFSLSKYMCVQVCPADNGKFKYKSNEFDRICYLSGENVPEKKQESRYYYQRTPLKPENRGESLVLDAVSMIKKMQVLLTEDLQENEKENTKRNLGFDKSCFFKGKVRENLSVEKETFMECDCAEDAYGTRCQYLEENYKSINGFIHQMLKEVKWA